MSKSVLRVVFDTNTFSPSNFELLANGPLVRLCKVGRIVAVYGHVFLEEVWRAYGNENRRPHLVERWIPFIVATVDRFCLDFITIWHRELVQGLGHKTNIFMRPRDQQKLIENLRHVPLDGSWAAWRRAQKQLAEEDTKRAAQREVSKEIRQEVADKLKAAGYNKQQRGGPAPFEEFLAREIDHAGRGFIHAQVKCNNSDEVWRRWSGDKAAYPYFTTFVRNMTYIGYYAATRPNNKIDLNAQADLDLMTHLLWADAVVSNEVGFLRSAFDDLWRPKGKVLFTSEGFAKFIEKL
jgi:predicted NUDIX family NTP pyrophosphohydrolase